MVLGFERWSCFDDQRFIMTWPMYGIIIIFGVFLLLLVINPRLSCFGKRVTSPIYPLVKRKRLKAMRAEEYGLSLGDEDNEPVDESRDGRLSNSGDSE